MHRSRIALVLSLVFGWMIVPMGSPAEETVSVLQLVRQSENEVAAGNLEDAQELALRATEQDPAWAPGWRQYGIALLRDDQAEASIPAFQQAVGLDAEEANAWRGLSLALWRVERQNEAVHALSSYLRLKPQDHGGWRDIATWLIHLGRLEQAVLALQRVLELKEDDLSAWRDLSVLHQRLERFDEAILSLTRVLELNNEDVSSWRELSAVYQRKDRLEQAIAAMERALALDEEDAPSWRALGAMHLRQGQRDEAVKALERSLVLRPDDPAVLRDLGWCLWEMDRRPEAIERLEKAVNLDVAERESVVRQVAARLSEEGAADEAMAFVRRVDPDVPLSAVAKDMVDRGRLMAAEPLLAEAWQQEEVPLIGLYLAYARAVNGRVADVDLYLGPFIGEAADANDDQLSMALETLKLCAANPVTPELLSRIEGIVGARPQFRTRLADVLEKSADAMRARGMAGQALMLYRRALEHEPDRMSWIWAFQLSQERETVDETDALLADIAERSTLPVVRSGVEGIRADRAGLPERVVEQLGESLSIEPDQPVLRMILFSNYLKLWQIGEAYAQANWFQERVDHGESSMRSYLAETWARLGETKRALDLWQLLHLSFPEQLYYGMETASSLYRLGRAEEALDVLREMTQDIEDHRIYELGAEIAAALDRTEESVEWAVDGMKVAPSLGLLRIHAENSERLGDYPAALESAQAYLERDPGYTPMALLAGRALIALERREEARHLYEALLERNPVLLPALTALRDVAVIEGRFGDAVAVSHTRLVVQPDDPDALRQKAHAMAQSDQFRPALQALRRLARRPVSDAVPVLVYRNITAQDYPGRNSVDQIALHIELLAEQGYRFITTRNESAAYPHERRVMIILLDPDARVVEAMDSVLQEMNARVLYTGNATVPKDMVPGMPFPNRLGPVLQSDRWHRTSSGPESVTRLPINEAGVMGHRFVQPVWVEGSAEDDVDFADRVNRALADAARPLDGEPERLLVYPAGDFGQRALDVKAAPEPERPSSTSLNATLAGLDRFRSVVGQHFTQAVYFDAVGFWLAETDPLRIPARLVPPQWDEAALLHYLTQDNPLVNARLELARILYWHGQYEDAIRWFAEAEAAGADPLAATFNRGMASHMQGDTHTALAMLRAAREMDPESERVAAALSRSEDRLRPRAQIFLRGWEDNEDRSFQQYGVTGGLHVSDRLYLGPSLDYNRWRTKGIGSEEGFRTGAHARVFLVPQVWVTGRMWHLTLDEGDNRWGGSAALRVPNPILSGHLEVAASREEIDTLEALRAEIDARIIALHTYTRLLDNFDLFADLSRNARTDGNDTDMLEGRLLYRLNHWPYAGLGVRSRFGDSDFQADEYWAPDRLEQHQLHASLRRSWNGTRGALSGSAGYARERTTDWRFVWGARTEVDISLNDWLELNASLGWFEGPVYERLTWTGGLTGKF